MEIRDQISNFKSMVNSYKLTNLIIASTNIGIFNCLTSNTKCLNDIANDIGAMEEKLEPLLNALVFHDIISKNDGGYFLDKYKDILDRNSKYNQLGYVDFANTIMKKYQFLEETVSNEELPFLHKSNISFTTSDSIGSISK